MSTKKCAALMVSVCAVMFACGIAFAGIADWMPTQEQMEQMGQIADWWNQQQKEKEMQQLKQQQQYLQWQRGTQTQEKREASKTTLMEAARKESVDELRKLIKAGENVNAKDYDGDTALTYAVKENTLEVVQFLIDSGGYVNERTLDAAVKRKDLAILRTILKKGFDKDTLNQALGNIYVSDTNTGVILALKEAGADINHKNSYGETILMKIASLENANSDAVEDIISMGANVNAKDNNRKTPLMRAASNGNASVVRVLIDAGATVNIRDNYGTTALMYAARWNTPDVVYALLNAGANVHMKDNEGRKAVDYAKPAYFGWDGGNPKLKDTYAFYRLGKSEIRFKSLW